AVDDINISGDPYAAMSRCVLGKFAGLNGSDEATRPALRHLIPGLCLFKRWQFWVVQLAHVTGIRGNNLPCPTDEYCATLRVDGGLDQFDRPSWTDGFGHNFDFARVQFAEDIEADARGNEIFTRLVCFQFGGD